MDSIRAIEVATRELTAQRGNLMGGYESRREEIQEAVNVLSDLRDVLIEHSTEHQAARYVPTWKNPRFDSKTGRVSVDRA